MHPMTQFAIALTAMQTDSKFAAAYSQVCVYVCVTTILYA
jgi:hypothetical protein